MATDAQKRARDKWNREHAKQSRIYSIRSTTKRFIKEYATEKDISDLRKLLDQREQVLHDNDKAR